MCELCKRNRSQVTVHRPSDLRIFALCKGCGAYLSGEAETRSDGISAPRGRMSQSEFRERVRNSGIARLLKIG
jgi:hypothetical protein